MAPIIQKNNSLESGLQVLSDDELAAKTIAFRERLNQGEKLDNLLPEAFAVVREVGKRKLNMRHLMFSLLAVWYCMKARLLK
jgi:preprotein translocase subunit SecA